MHVVFKGNSFVNNFCETHHLMKQKQVDNDGGLLSLEGILS